MWYGSSLAVVVILQATPSFSSAQHRLTAAMTPGFGRGYMTTPGQEYLLTPDSVVPAKNSSTKSGSVLLGAIVKRRAQRY